MSVEYDVVLVGAGLCGLATALLLKQNKLRVLVLESRAEAGGRIRSVRDSQTQEFLGDLGPTWERPALCLTAKHWLDKLGISTVTQFRGENSLLESSPEIAPQVHAVSDFKKTYRIEAGTSRLVEVLCDELGESTVCRNERVTRVDSTGKNVDVHSNARPAPVSARRVVLAMPPRVLQRNIRFNPAMPERVSATLQKSPTAMAETAKVVLLYTHAFWRDLPHGGRIFSKIGPLGELQDHSGPGGFPAALTGYFTWPHQLRTGADAELQTAIKAQLKRFFGPEAPLPLQIIIKDWAKDNLVTTPLDLAGNPGQRSLLPEFMRESLMNDRVWLAGAEFAAVNPGLIEGALSSADHTAGLVTESLSAE